MSTKYTTFGETPVKYQCTKQKCKWQGTLQEQEISKNNDSIGSSYVCPNCGNAEFYGLREGLIFIHLQSRNKGVFIKEYKPTGKPRTMQIKLSNGEVYFAPSSEFKQTK
jgi:hypothetical protein